MVIMCHRNSDPVPPNRTLYGQRGGKLIFPMDLAFSSYAPPGKMAPSSPPILHSTILGTGGNPIAVIESYDWPPVGKVTPVVVASPTANIDLTQVLSLSSHPPALVSDGTQVIATNQDGDQISGVIKGFTTVSYLDAQHEIEAYQAIFNPPLFGEDHGLPVFRADNPEILVGMVISTSSSPKVNAFIARI